MTAQEMLDNLEMERYSYGGQWWIPEHRVVQLMEMYANQIKTNSDENRDKRNP